MTLRSAPPAPLNMVQRMMLAIIANGGEATDDHLISHLAAPTETVARTLSSLEQVGYVELTGERKVGWARRRRPLWKITETGRHRAATFITPPRQRRKTAR